MQQGTQDPAAHDLLGSDLSENLLGRDLADLDDEQRRVIASIADGRPIARDVADETDDRSTFWDRLADRVAAVGGSWSFIFGFTGLLVGWMLLNTDVLAHWHLQFDPYPYIFLNLMLSMIAALQAPVIMMSQNRQAGADRLAASHDYEVNLRAELEIMRLHGRLARMEEAQARILQQLRSRDVPTDPTSPLVWQNGNTISNGEQETP